MSTSGTSSLGAALPAGDDRRQQRGIPWPEVRALYLGSGLSLELVAAEFGLSPATVRNRAKAERWLLEKRRLWRQGIIEGKRVFEADLARRVAELITIDANDSAGQLQQLHELRQRQGARWGPMDHAAYARACELASNRARRALGMRDDASAPGIQDISFSWLPPDLRPEVPRVVEGVNLAGDPSSKPRQGG